MKAGRVVCLVRPLVARDNLGVWSVLDYAD